MSCDYSSKMLEAKYNTIRCKVLLGEKDNIISELVKLIKLDTAYSVKIEIDNDFIAIHDIYHQYIIEEEKRINKEKERRVAEEKRKAEEEQQKIVEKKKREEEKQRIIAEEKQKVEEQRRIAEEKQKAEEIQRRIAKEKIQRQKQEWKTKGLCLYCGGEFGGLFTKKCKTCGNIKSY